MIDSDTKLDWTTLSSPQKLRALQKFFMAGLTSGQIVSKFRNASRSAIISHFHRHSGKIRAISQPAAKIPPPPARNRPRPKPIGNPESKVVPVIIEESDFSEAVPFIDALNGNLCKWPLWNDFEGPRQSMCCGKARMEGKPYCETHVERARDVYVKPIKKRKIDKWRR